MYINYLVDCGAVCHPKCLPNLLNNCGMPSEYTRYMSEVMTRAQAVTLSGAWPSVASLKLHLSGYMKILK